MAKPKKPTKSAEEIRKQKRECERRRRARIKNDPVLYEAAKAKDRARLASKKEKKIIKLVADMTPREHRWQLKQWRERKARSRLNQKRKKALQNHLRENTPATSDEEAIIRRPGSDLLINEDAAASSPPVSPSLLDPRPPNPRADVTAPHEYSENRRQSRCDSASSIGLRSLRSTPRLSSHNSPSCTECSTPSRQMLTGIEVGKKKHKATVLLVKKQNQVIQRMQRKIHHLRVQLSRAVHPKSVVKFVPEKKSPVKTRPDKTKILRDAIKKFLERDDNTKMCPGKKDCITKNKMKKQKRYLTDTMINLHKKFLSETRFKISLATFYRMRPFWIVQRQISERDTCLCVVHENMQLMFDKLKYLKIISGQSLLELCKTLVCDINKDACMLRKCEICKNKVPKIEEFDDSSETTYKLWTVTKEKRIIQGKEKEVRRTVKTEEVISKKSLFLKFLEGLDSFLQHIYFIRHQYAATTSLKNNLSVGEMFMQVDFAENYCCKYADEIQAVHFGASRLQISLHTGVYYYKCPDTGELKTKSFCTVSDCLRHDASAVYAHIGKIIRQIYLSIPNSLNTLHILSDGPTAQYRNRKAFYLFSQYLTRRYGIKLATWNFNEAGHGKGPMDGVGAVVKRTADRKVAEGNDIPDLVTFMKFVESANINVDISVVTEADIEDVDKILSDKGKSIPGTLKIHQITWDATNSSRIFLRRLTCVTCKPGEMCPHYSLPKGYVDFVDSVCLADVPGPSIEIVAGDVPAETIYNLSSKDNENEVPCDASDAITMTEQRSSGPDYTEGMWIVVRFLTKKTEKHFLGQIIGFEGVEPKVKFAKKKRLTKDHIIFIWIDPEDIFPVPGEDIIAVLSEPTPGRRGELEFKVEDLTAYANIQ